MGENMNESSSKKQSPPIAYAVFFDQAEIYSAVLAPLMEQADKGSNSQKKLTRGIFQVFLHSIRICDSRFLNPIRIVHY